MNAVSFDMAFSNATCLSVIMREKLSPGSASIKTSNVEGVEIREERATIPWPTIAF